jgi:uncharacterized protein YecE (DUF72 family)
VAYLAGYFDALEINVSFYRAVPRETARRWTAQAAANPRFRFTAKLHRSFTHEGNPSDAEERGFREMADTLTEEGRLGAVLVQFPWSFRNGQENRRYVAALLERFAPYPLVVEMRHGSWNHAGFYKLLEDRQAGFCNVDQPVIRKSLEPTAIATAPVGYVRLHGRNAKEWFGDSGRDARYNYLYSREELIPWKDRIGKLAGKAANIYAITNNHFRGQAAANALELVSLLLDAPVPAPASLVAAYPQLEKCTVTDQGRLFSG